MTNQLHNVDIPHFIMSADIVNLADRPALENQVNGAAVVSHVEPVAHVDSLSVDRERLIMQGVDNHQRNELFWKMIRAIVITAPADRDGQSVSTIIGQSKQIRARLGRGVGT